MVLKFAASMFAVQLVLFCTVAVPLFFTEGEFYFSSTEAWMHALERGSVVAFLIALSTTGSHVRRSRKSGYPGTLYSKYRIEFGARRQEARENLGTQIALLPHVKAVKRYDEHTWEVSMNGSIAPRDCVKLYFAQDSSALEYSARYPLLFPVGPPRSRGLDALISLCTGAQVQGNNPT